MNDAQIQLGNIVTLHLGSTVRLITGLCDHYSVYCTEPEVVWQKTKKIKLSLKNWTRLLIGGGGYLWLYFGSVLLPMCLAWILPC